jgi:hypothetical protein
MTLLGKINAMLTPLVAVLPLDHGRLMGDPFNWCMGRW